MPRKNKKQNKQKKQKKTHNIHTCNNAQNNNNNNNNNNQKKNKRRKNKKRRRNDDIDEEFKKHLESLGYFIREVGGDGNCLFRSVSEQMEGNENNYKEYREKCVNYIKENKDFFAPFIEDDETIDQYIDRMSKNKEWGGNLEIHALSKALEVNFYIYKEEDKQMFIVKNFEKPKKNVSLTYHDGKHFNSLRKLEEKNKADKEKEEKRKKKKEGEENEESDDNEEDEKDENDDINDLINKVDHLNI